LTPVDAVPLAGYTPLYPVKYDVKDFPRNLGETMLRCASLFFLLLLLATACGSHTPGGRMPTVTVRGDIYGGEQPASVVAQILPTLDEVRAQLPSGYLLQVGGTVEDSARGQNSVNAGVPLFLIAVLTLLMIQLKSLSRSLLVMLTAPLGLIGVVLFLLVFRVPFGFVAMLGTIALAGMIMRNSVILVDQIEQDIAAGHPPTQAVIDATVRRFRPIVLTALAAVLAMIPLSRSVFFGPMAVAIMGGLIVATALTLLFLPALYAAWFRVPPPPAEAAGAPRHPQPFDSGSR
jgi:multidrug efflux pump